MRKRTTPDTTDTYTHSHQPHLSPNDTQQHPITPTKRGAQLLWHLCRGAPVQRPVQGARVVARNLRAATGHERPTGGGAAGVREGEARVRLGVAAQGLASVCDARCRDRSACRGGCGRPCCRAHEYVRAWLSVLPLPQPSLLHPWPFGFHCDSSTCNAQSLILTWHMCIRTCVPFCVLYSYCTGWPTRCRARCGAVRCRRPQRGAG